MSPFTKRILLMLCAFVLLLPIVRLFDRGTGHIVKATGLPGATVSGGPLTVSTATPTTVAAVPDTSAQDASAADDSAAAAPSSSTARSTAAKPSYSQSAPKRSSTSSSGGSSSGSNKTTATTSAKASAPATAAKPKPKPPVTVAPKPKPPVTAPAPPPPTAAPPPSNYTTDQIIAIIRQIWPDNLENQAIAIAQRESHLIPTSHNYCCYGLFAIYFNAGKTLLNSIGITSPQQLYDPTTNARAAYAIYLAAGWGPWKL